MSFVARRRDRPGEAAPVLATLAADNVGLAKETTLSALKNVVASEATLNAVKAQIDKLTFDSLNRLKVLLENLPNPSNLDVALSTRASEATLASELVRKVKGDRGLLKQVSATDLRLDVYASYVANPSNLDVALSTRASEATLSAIKNALASVGTDKLRVSVVDSLPSGTNEVGAVRLPDVKDAVTASGRVTAASNTAGLAVAINNDWRTLVQFRATLGGAGTVILEASPDGENYFFLWSKSLTAAGSYCDWDLCAFPYFRVRVPTTGIDIAVDIRAVKL